jgi:hypothetical protein
VGTRLGWLAVSIAALGALGASAPAAAAEAEGLVQVVRPEPGEPVPSDGARVEAVVPRGASVAAEIAGRDVTSAIGLRRSHGGRRVVGRIPRSVVGELPEPFGITAQAGRRRDRDDVLIRALRLRKDFADVRITHEGRSVPTAVIDTQRHRVWLRVELNGEAIEERAVSDKLGQRRVQLSAAEGLRPRRNVLRVTAIDSRGRGEVVARRFRVPAAPIAGAIAPARARAGARLHLDSTTSRGARLAHSWSIEEAPDGSNARLRKAGSPRPRFTPDVPGRYRLGLQVTGGAGGREARAGSQSSLSLSVAVQEPVPPYGIPLRTSAQAGITIGERTVPPPAGPGGIVLVPIDAATGAIGTPASFSPQLDLQPDIASLIAEVEGQDPDNLVAILVSGGGAKASQYASGEGEVQLDSALSTLGLDNDLVRDAAFALTAGEPLAIVGQPGSAPGSGSAAAAPEQAGAISGFLRPTGIGDDLTGELAFIQPDFRRFQFGGGAGSTTVTPVNPGPAVEPSQALDQPLGPGEVMRATVLDAFTLEPVATATGTGSDDFFPNPADRPLGPVAALLQQYQDDENKLILFKMSNAAAFESTRIELSAISKSLAALGGNRDAFIRSLGFGTNESDNPPYVPHPASDYVFFGGASSDPVEGTEQVTYPTLDSDGGETTDVLTPANAVGTLRMDRSGRWTVAGSTSVTDVEASLTAIAEAEPTEFAYPTDVVPGSESQYAAAENRLFEVLDSAPADIFCDASEPTCQVVPGVRVNYPNPELLENLSAAQSALLCNPGEEGKIEPEPGAVYTQEQLDALRTAVCNELTQVEDVVDKLFGELYVPDPKSPGGVYGVLQNDSALDLLGQSDTFIGFLEDERNAQLDKKSSILGISGEAGEILGDLFTIGTEIAKAVIGPEAEIPTIAIGTAGVTLTGDVLGEASSAIGLGESADKVAPEEVTVGNIASYLNTSFGYAGARVLDLRSLILSDPSKLAQVYEQVRAGGWDLETPVADGYQAANVVEFHQRVAAWQYMLPRQISVVAKACDSGGSSNDPTTYVAWSALRESQQVETGPSPEYLVPNVARLRSAHLTQGDAQTLGAKLFDPIYQPGTNPLAVGPNAAGLAPSPFFMTDIAPTSQDNENWGACGELFHP